MSRTIRPQRKRRILSLPRVGVDGEGKISPADFDRFAQSISEWSRDIGDSAGQDDYTPELTGSVTNPTLGTGGVRFGTWRFSDGLIFWHVYFQFGTAGTAAGSGNYQISIPFRAKTRTRTLLLFDGSAELNNSGTVYRRFIRLGTGTETYFLMHSGADPAVFVTHAVPFGWGAGDSIMANGWYEPAAPHLIRAAVT